MNLVKCYHIIMIEQEVAHDLWEHEYNGILYDSFAEAQIVLEEQAMRVPRVCNAWIETYGIDVDGYEWDVSYEWQTGKLEDWIYELYK